jgi:hypothetical protein
VAGYEAFEIETQAGALAGSEDGVVRILLKEGVHLVDDDIAALHTAFLTRVQDPRPIMVDTRRIGSMTRDARKRAAGGAISDLTKRLAILIESPISLMIARFFTHVSRPPYATEIFRDEADAIRWLLDE